MPAGGGIIIDHNIAGDHAADYHLPGSQFDLERLAFRAGNCHRPHVFIPAQEFIDLFTALVKCTPGASEKPARDTHSIEQILVIFNMRTFFYTP
jgi:hypothetical protein